MHFSKKIPRLKYCVPQAPFNNDGCSVRVNRVPDGAGSSIDSSPSGIGRAGQSSQPWDLGQVASPLLTSASSCVKRGL